MRTETSSNSRDLIADNNPLKKVREAINSLPNPFVTPKSASLVEAIYSLHHPFATPNASALRVAIEKARRGLRKATIEAWSSDYDKVESFEIRPYDSDFEMAGTISTYQFKVGDKFVVDMDGNVHVAFGCGVHSMYVIINPANGTAWVKTDSLPSSQCWDGLGEEDNALVRALNVTRTLRVIGVEGEGVIINLLTKRRV